MFEYVGQPPQRETAQIRDPHAHRAQCRRDITGNRDIVEAGQRDVLRHAHAGFTEGTEAAHRHDVVGGEHGPRASLSCQQLVTGAIAGFLGEVTGHDSQRSTGRVLRHRRAIALFTLACVEVAVRTGDERHVGVACAQQMPDHGRGTGVIVHIEHTVGRILHRAVEQYHRQGFGHVGAQESRIDAAGQDQQAVDATLH